VLVVGSGAFLLLRSIRAPAAESVEGVEEDAGASSDSNPTSLDGAPSDAATAESGRSAAPDRDPGIAPRPGAAATDNPYQLRGAVKATDGSSPRGVQMTLVDAQGATLKPEWSGNTYYFEAGLHAGPWTIRATSPLMRDLDLRVEFAPDNPVLRRDLVLLSSFEIAVSFKTPAGRDLFDDLADDRPRVPIVPAITPAPPGESVDASVLPMPVGDGDGYWRGPGSSKEVAEGDNLVCTGVLTVLRPFPVFVSAVLGERVVATRAADAHTESLEFVIPPELVRGLLVDATLRVEDELTRKPLGDIVVQLGLAGARTDAQGVVRFERMLPGSFSLRIMQPGYGSVFEQVRVGNGPVCDLGIVRLAPAVAIRGRVLGVDGKPASATVYATPESSDGAPAEAGWTSSAQRHSVSDKVGGAFVMTDLAAGRWSVDARAGTAYSKEVLVDTTAGPAEEVVLELRPATHVSLVPTGRLGERYETRILDARSRFMMGVSFSSGSTQLWLPPGKYVLEWNSESITTVRTPFEVADQHVVVKLQP
jgi:hypothetical protein